MFSPGFSVAHDAEHSLLQRRLDTDEASVTTLQGQMTTANSNISTLQGQMTTANSNIAALQAGAIGSGTWAARPGSPSANQLYYATDRATLYFWSAGFGRWLTTDTYETTILPTTYGNPVSYAGSAATVAYGGVNHFAVHTDFMFDSFEVMCRTAATYDSTHHWQVNFGVGTPSGANTDISGVSIYNASKAAANTIYNFSNGSNGVIYNANTAAYLYINVFQGASIGIFNAGSLSVYKYSAWIRMAG